MIIITITITVTVANTSLLEGDPTGYHPFKIFKDPSVV
jgi:hypothetical protein